MGAAFSLAIVLYALCVAVACAVTALRGRSRSPLIGPMLILIEFCLLAQAAVDLVHLAAGPRPAELATHVGYLAASVIVLPAAAASVRLEGNRWGSAALAVGCVVAAVVSIRLHQTLGTAARG